MPGKFGNNNVYICDCVKNIVISCVYTYEILSTMNIALGSGFSSVVRALVFKLKCSGFELRFGHSSFFIKYMPI